MSRVRGKLLVSRQRISGFWVWARAGAAKGAVRAAVATPETRERRFIRFPSSELILAASMPGALRPGQCGAGCCPCRRGSRLGGKQGGGDGKRSCLRGRGALAGWGQD